MQDLKSSKQQLTISLFFFLGCPKDVQVKEPGPNRVKFSPLSEKYVHLDSFCRIEPKFPNIEAAKKNLSIWIV